MYTESDNIFIILFQVSLGNLFKNINLKRIASSSLSFMHEQEELDISRTIQVKPMEINAYRVDF